MVILSKIKYQIGLGSRCSEAQSVKYQAECQVAGYVICQKIISKSQKINLPPLHLSSGPLSVVMASSLCLLSKYPSLGSSWAPAVRPSNKLEVVFIGD